MLLKIAIGLLVIIGGFMGYVALQPGDFRVIREISINAPAEVIFSHINDARKMSAWNPWLKVDPNTKVSYEGPGEGVGAMTRWEGNSQSGTGSSTVTEVIPNSVAKARIDFEKPFKGTNFSEFSLKQDGSQTLVTWIVHGKSSFIPRLMCTLFFNMDKMIGDTLAKGLADLKITAETPATN